MVGGESLTGLVTSIHLSVLESLKCPLISSFTFGYIHHNTTHEQELTMVYKRLRLPG